MTGKNCAIAIGINNYHNIESLRYAQRDAAVMRAYFQAELQFERVLHFAEDGDYLPTYAILRRLLRKCSESLKLEAGDNLWFFFAGHGQRYENRDYLLPIDVDPGDIEGTAIPLQYVTERLTQCGSDNVILLIDACRHTEQNTGRRDGQGGVGVVRYPGVVTFYSCSPFEYSYEIKQLEQGAFTYALLAGLRRQGEGNCATVERLDRHLSVAVPELNRKYGKPVQTPKAEAAPASKYHLILLPRQANDADVNQLRVDAFEAEIQQQWKQAEELWTRVWYLAPGDQRAKAAIKRIAVQLAAGPEMLPTVNAEPAGEKSVRAVATQVQGILGSVQSTTQKVQRPQQSVLTYPFEYVKVDAKGKIVERNQGEAEYYSEDLGEGVTLEMTAIPGGSFKMGSPKSEWKSYNDEQPVHSVRVKAFWIGKFAITQVQWARVANFPKVESDLNPDPAHFKDLNNPVEQVSWHEAIEFCARLSKQTGKQYRLPSEAEWEYACRAGTTTPFYGGETITTDLANYRGQDWEYEGKTYPGYYNKGPRGVFREKTLTVGQFPANDWGLFDMHGNVFEWCADHWHDNYHDAPIDGSAWIKDGNSNHCILRGGSWLNFPRRCRSAYRGSITPGDRVDYIGFRVVCSAPGQS